MSVLAAAIFAVMTVSLVLCHLMVLRQSTLLREMNRELQEILQEARLPLLEVPKDLSGRGALDLARPAPADPLTERTRQDHCGHDDLS